MHRVILAAVMCATLASCSAAQLAATATPAAFSPEMVVRLQSICRQGQPLVTLAAHPAMPASVQEIGVFVQSYCGALLAGQLPTTTDANTGSWLQQNLAALQMSLGR